MIDYSVVFSCTDMLYDVVHLYMTKGDDLCSKRQLLAPFEHNDLGATTVLVKLAGVGCGGRRGCTLCYEGRGGRLLIYAGGYPLVPKDKA